MSELSPGNPGNSLFSVRDCLCSCIADETKTRHSNAKYDRASFSALISPIQHLEPNAQLMFRLCEDLVVVRKAGYIDKQTVVLVSVREELEIQKLEATRASRDRRTSPRPRE